MQVAADARAALPVRAAWVGLAGFVAGVLLALGGALLGRALAPDVLLVRLLLSQAGLWSGLLGACVVASRRWGTGELRADYGLRARGSDVGRGLLLSLGARLGGGLALAVLVAVAPGLAGSNTEIFSLAEGDRPALLALAVLAVVGAPLVEETFFRGLLLRSLRSRLPSTRRSRCRRSRSASPQRPWARAAQRRARARRRGRRPGAGGAAER